MRKGGIFNGFGAADLAGQTLKLAPASEGGSAPLASAMQTVLKNTYGVTNLVVDGKWGDCSQQAFINSTGTKPSPEAVVNMLGLEEFGVLPSQLKTWTKTPVCSNSTAAPTGNSSYVDPVSVVAQQFGIPIPGSGGCAAGWYRNVQTGQCEQLEQPQTLPPKSTSLLQTIKFALAPSTPTFSKVPVSSSNVVTLKPITVASSTPILQSKVQLAPSSEKKFSIVPFAPQNRVGTAPAGMSSTAKVAVGVGLLAVLGGVGYWAWKRSQGSAVPNCGWAANCGE